MAVELATGYISLVPSAQGISSKLAQELDLDAVATKAGQQAGKTLGKSILTAATATGIGVAIGSFFRASFGEAEEAQKVGAQTAAVLRSTGEAAHVSADQIGELASALSSKAGVDDEAIQSAENVLLTFTKVRNEVGKGNDVFNRATSVVLDMSVALGQDLQSSAIQVGKALNDPVKGVSALQRVGVTFTEQQKAQIATLVESGNVLGAQKVILRELATEFGGSAAAQATAADKAKVAIGNLKESVGVALLPAFEAGADAISFFTDQLNQLPAPVRNAVVDVGLLTGGVLGVATVIAKVKDAHLAEFGSSIANGVRDATGAVGKLKDAFLAVDKAQLLTNIGITGGILGIGALIVALGSSAGAYERMEQAAQRWVATTVSGAQKSSNELKTLRATQADLEAQITRLKNRFIDLNDAQARTAAGGAEEANRKNQETARSIDALEAKLRALLPEIDNVEQKHRENAAATAATRAQLDRYNASVTAGGSATDAFADLTDDAKQAVQDFQNTLVAASGGEVGYQQSLINQQKAQQDLNDAIAQYGPQSAEAREAQLNLQAAQLQGASAAAQLDAQNQALVEALRSGKISYDAQRAALEEQIRLHPEQAAGIQLEIDKLEAARTSAALLDLADPTVDVKADTSKFDEGASHIFATIERLTSGEAVVNFGTFAVVGGAPGRAGGGDVKAGTTYRVAERGWEFFVPNQDGRIIPHDQSVAMLQALEVGGGGQQGGLFAGATVNIGDGNVIPDLEYYAQTRLIGVP